MLVFSRRYNQSVIISGRVRVTVLHISPSYVELGIEAPQYVEVDREEVYLRKLRDGPERRRGRPARAKREARPAGYRLGVE